MSRSPQRLLILVLLAATFIGCAERPDALAEPGPPLWRLAADPTITIGGHDDRPTHALSKVRGGLLLGSGEIAIADGDSREIRIFSVAGAHVRTLGGRGGGPGEFSLLGSIAHGPEGGVCAWDSGPKRLTCFPQAEGPPTTADAELDSLHEAFFTDFVGAFPDGSFVLRDAESERDKRNEPTGERRDTVRYIHFAADGSFRTVVERLPGAESYFLNEGQVWGGVPILFGRNALEHLDGSLAIGVNDSLDVRFVDVSGAVITRIAAPVTSRRVDPDELDSARADTVAKMEADWARRTIRMDAAAEARVVAWRRRQAAERPHRATMPAFDELRVAHDGRLWIGEPRRLRAATQTWTVLDQSGDAVARLDVPAQAEVLDVGEDRVLLLVRDELDVESVLLMEIEKP